MQFKYVNYCLIVAGCLSVVNLFANEFPVRSEELQQQDSNLHSKPVKFEIFKANFQELSSLQSTQSIEETYPIEVSQFSLEKSPKFSRKNEQELPQIFSLKSTAIKSTADFLNHPPIQPNFDNFNSELQFSQDNNSSENKEDWPEPINDSQTYWFLLGDQLEYRGNDGEDSFNWDIHGWIGGDYQRLWLKSEGEIGLEEGHGEGEIQLLYGKLISPFFDLQLGLRYEQLYGESGAGRGFAVIGVEGLAPYFFEVEASLFISHEGDISARFEAEYELLLSQKLILQPSFETNLAIQKVEEFGVGSGLNDIEFGLRLRYEFSRNFAPYLGINWEKKFGDTAEFAREEGESDDQFSVLGGFRLLF